MNVVFHRAPNNPILTPADMPFPAAAVLNLGATVQNDEIVLLLRVEDHAGYSNIYVARSRDGVTGWRIDAEPILQYGQERWRYEMWGSEEARGHEGAGPRARHERRHHQLPEREHDRGRRRGRIQGSDA